MTEIFGLPIAEAIGLFVFALFYIFAVHSPELLALFIVWRRRKSMHRRLLFVVTVMGATYGLLVMFLIVVCVPITAFMLFIAPALRYQGYLEHAVLLALADYFVEWWWLLLPFVVLIPAIFIARYFAARWNRIVDALQD